MTLQEAAKILRISNKTALMLVKKQVICAYKYPTGHRKAGSYEVLTIPVSAGISTRTVSECLGVTVRRARSICSKIGTKKVGGQYRLSRQEIGKIVQLWG